MPFDGGGDEIFEEFFRLGIKPNLTPFNTIGYWGGSQADVATIVANKDRFQHTDGDVGPGVYFVERLAQNGERHETAYWAARVFAQRQKRVTLDDCVVLSASLGMERCYEVLSPENREFYRAAYAANVSEAMERSPGSERNILVTGVLRRALAFYAPTMAIQATRFVFPLKDESASSIAGPIYSLIVRDLMCIADVDLLPKN